MLITIKVNACPAVQIYKNNNKFSHGYVRPVPQSPTQLGAGGVLSGLFCIHMQGGDKFYTR